MANIHSLNIGGSTYVIEPNLINITAKTSGMSYVAFFSDRRAGGRYAYSYYGVFLNNTTGELQIPHLRLKHTNGNYGSYLRFGDGNYSYIFENPDDKLNIFSSRGSYIIGGPTYISSNYAYVSTLMYFYSNILPVNDSYSDIGSSDKRFSTIYADTFNGTATKSQQADQVAIHTKEFIQDSGLCSLNGMYEVPVILGGCDCTIFSDQPDADYFGLMTDYHPQNNNSNWLRYNFNDQTLKSTNFEGNFIGNASTATTATNANNTKVTVTSTSANYPLILGPSTTTGGAIMASGNKSLYMDSANNLYYNPSTNDLTVHSGYIIMPMDDKKGIMPATNNYGQVGFSDRKFWKMHASTFVGNLSGNATTATTATNANYIEVNATSTNAAYYLTFVNGTDGNRKTYVNSGITVNPATDTINTNISGNVTGNLTGRVLPKTTSITAIETTYTGVSGIEYHSNIKRHANGSNYYAGTAYGFPALSNANGVLNIETHPGSGPSYYLHQIGFSSDNRLYHRAFHGNNPNSVSSTPSNQNGKTWNSIPLCKPSNFGQVRNIEVVTSMPSSPNSYTLYLVLG